MEKAAEYPVRKRHRGSDGDEGPPHAKTSRPAASTRSTTATISTKAGRFTCTIPTITLRGVDASSSATKQGTKGDKQFSPSKFVNGDDITKAFEKYQAIYLPQYYRCPSSDGRRNVNIIDTKNTLNWKDLSCIYKKLCENDKESFCIENSGAAEVFAQDDNNNGKMYAGCVFMEDNRSAGTEMSDDNSSRINENKNEDNAAGYCSFMIQNDTDTLSDLLDKLPVRDPVTDASKFIGSSGDSNDTNSDNDNVGGSGWDYEPCLWIFFGRNNSANGKDLEGRPEHTDQISHDGTWHYQLSGTKRWLLRPTPQLLRSWKQNKENIASDGDDDNDGDLGKGDSIIEEAEEEPKQIGIDCRQGDVLIVNTRLWRHQTILPTQTEPSVSYARDFWINKTRKSDNARNDANAGQKSTMTNVDGTYAMDDIAEDTIIFKEDDMPDCELHRSSDAEKANCKVVELEDGLQAVVSSRFISAGEFFCIPESSDEENSEGEGEGEEGEHWFGDEDDE